jgi:two-component system, chemotaxis family, response regulator PixG
MTTVSNKTIQVTPDLHQIKVLEKLASDRASGCFHLVSGSMQWMIFIEAGVIIYATHNVEPLDRLERHLRRLSHQILTLTKDVRIQLRVEFDHYPRKDRTDCADYQAICWLVQHQYLTHLEAGRLVDSLISEVFESYLLAQSTHSKFIETARIIPTYTQLQVSDVIASTKKQLQQWQSLGPEVRSPYQRPYFLNQSKAEQRFSPESQQKLAKILKGFSIRHLSALLNQDELKLARVLRSYIQDGTIILREAQPPFNQIPSLSDRTLAPSSFMPLNPLPTEEGDMGLGGFSTTALPQQQRKIVCIDDSAAMLEQLNRFLEEENFAVFTLNDPIKASMEIMRIKPDLILLDVGMPNIDGYKFCRIIRNHSHFKTIPIIMVTGNTGLIDRAKARLAGATDYMTKPFVQSELLKMVFRYLS